jgi:hypothetical protein
MTSLNKLSDYRSKIYRLIFSLAAFYNRGFDGIALPMDCDIWMETDSGKGKRPTRSHYTPGSN